jgi:L-lactate dehydrogenase complex protein LldG
VENERSPVGGYPNEGASALLEKYKRALIEAEIGITIADYAIADRGTPVPVLGGERHRLISLMPPVHVCLLSSAHITASANDLMSMLREQCYSGETGKPQATTFIIISSRIADIEHTVTLGVHGPREVNILLLQSV